MPLNLLVVIPAFNEQRFIEGCIESVRKCLSDTKIAFEIVVVDNGSTDSTAAIAEQSGTTVISIERASVSRARNVGANSQPSQYIAFVDADVIVTKDWASAIEQLLSRENTSPILTGCQYSVRDDGGVIEKYWFQNLKDKHLNGGNIIVSRDAFDIIGGFDESFKTGEDYDFCIRAQDKSIEYRLDERFKTIHLGYPRDLKNFVRRELWHGEGDFRSMQTFLASPVAILGVGYPIATIIVFLLLFLGQCGLFLLALAMFLTGNLVLTAVRFRGVPFKTLIINSAINYIYFVARGMSALKAFANRKNRY